VIGADRDALTSLMPNCLAIGKSSGPKRTIAGMLWRAQTDALTV
jgi:hypothetical protein